MSTSVNGPLSNFRGSDMIMNAMTRLPICLCLDISPSMSGRPEFNTHEVRGVPIDQLNKGVQLFYRTLKQNPDTAHCAEVAIVAFSGPVWVVKEFETVADAVPPQLELDMKVGGTSIGSGVKKSLELLDQRKQQYKRAGISYYQPWLVVMTDGEPTDESHVQMAKDVIARVNARKLTLFPIGVGPSADLAALKVFSPRRDPVRLRGLQFEQMFEWLCQSASATSRSHPSDTEVPLPPIDPIKGWADL